MIAKTAILTRQRARFRTGLRLRRWSASSSGRRGLRFHEDLLAAALSRFYRLLPVGWPRFVDRWCWKSDLFRITSEQKPCIIAAKSMLVSGELGRISRKDKAR